MPDANVSLRTIKYKVTRVEEMPHTNIIRFVPADRPRETELRLNEKYYQGEVIFHGEQDEHQLAI